MSEVRIQSAQQKLAIIQSAEKQGGLVTVNKSGELKVAGRLDRAVLWIKDHLPGKLSKSGLEVGYQNHHQKNNVLVARNYQNAVLNELRGSLPTSSGAATALSDYTVKSRKEVVNSAYNQALHSTVAEAMLREIRSLPTKAADIDIKEVDENIGELLDDESRLFQQLKPLVITGADGRNAMGIANMLTGQIARRIEGLLDDHQVAMSGRNQQQDTLRELQAREPADSSALSGVSESVERTEQSILAIESQLNRANTALERLDSMVEHYQTEQRAKRDVDEIHPQSRVSQPGEDADGRPRRVRFAPAENNQVFQDDLSPTDADLARAPLPKSRPVETENLHEKKANDAFVRALKADANQRSPKSTPSE